MNTIIRSKFYAILSCLLPFMPIQEVVCQPPKVGILVFEGVQIIDFSGPYETFGQAGYDVYTISETTTLQKANMGLGIVANYDFQNAPPPDILVLPGGNVRHNQDPSSEANQWIGKVIQSVKYTLTVCNGIFYLGPTGILQNKEATTNAGMIDHMAHFIRDVIPVKDRRVVISDNVVSSGGLSAGIDGALQIVSILDSPGRAQEVANQMEYNWDKKNKYVRSLLADIDLAKILDTNPPLNKKTQLYEGNTHFWNAGFKVRRNATIEEFGKELSAIAGHYRWDLSAEVKENSSRFYSWTYLRNGVKTQLDLSIKQIKENYFDLSIEVKNR